MDIDIYQQCPCHSEKKIKFCCGKEIISDLNQVLAKNSAGQSQAALDQLDRTISRSGPKDCLLTIQTHILIATGQIEKAKESNALFLKSNPKHSTGLHHRALIELAEEKISQSVNSLQDAMDAITGNEIPISLSNAFRVIGLGLLSEGHLVGARAHLKYASALKGGNDDELQRMIYETFRIPRSSLLLKQDFSLAPVPENVEWAKWFRNAHLALDRGQFRKGLRFLKKIDEHEPDQPVVLHGMAILNMFLGDLPGIVAAWRRYSRLPGLPDYEAVEAEAIAQLFDSESTTRSIDIVRVTFELTETDGASEAALSSSRLAAMQPIEEDPFEEGPPPRSAFYVLDKDKLNSAADVSIDDLPEVIGELMLFGKQTDRPARLEWITSKNDGFESAKQQLQEIFGSYLSGEPNEQVVAETDEVGDALSWNWHLPDGITREQHAQLVKQQRSRVLLEKWANIAFPVLNGKTPLEASSDPQMGIPLKALLTHLEQSPDGQVSEDDAMEELRKTLGIQPQPRIDPNSVGDGAISPVQQQFLQFDKLSDDQLLEIQSQAMAIGNIKVLKQVVPEILNRPELERVPRDMCYSMMAQFTADDEEALDYLAQARAEAKKMERPIGLYLVQEFEFRLSRGLTEKLPALLQTIQLHHLEDPDVEYELGRVLQRYGLLQRGPEQANPGAAGDATPEPSGIWTPESDATDPAQSSSVEKEPSKLWIPD